LITQKKKKDCQETFSSALNRVNEEWLKNTQVESVGKELVSNEVHGLFISGL